MRGRPSAPLRTDAEAWALVVQHRALASIPVGRWRTVHDPDDINQEALLGLFKAARTWDPEHGEFASWAQYYMRTAAGHMRNPHGLTRAQVLRRIAAGEPPPTLYSLDAPIGDEDGSTLRGDRIPEPTPHTALALARRDRVKVLADLHRVACRYPNAGARAAMFWLRSEDEQVQKVAKRYKITRANLRAWIDRLYNEYHHERARGLAAARRNHRSPR